eukprot:1159741-Pelagomonas_calceolata.AAC.6
MQLNCAVVVQVHGVICSCAVATTPDLIPAVEPSRQSPTQYPPTGAWHQCMQQVLELSVSLSTWSVGSRSAEAFHFHFVAGLVAKNPPHLGALQQRPGKAPPES